MAKGITSAMETQIDAAQRRPALLFELGLSSTLRYCAAKSNITFDGNTYTAKAVELSDISHALEGNISGVTVKFDNTAADMTAYANAQEFAGKTLTIKRIFLDDYDDSTDYVEIFRGKMERPGDITKNWFTIKASSKSKLQTKLIERKYSKLCPWEFGGTQCNENGNADLTSLTASGTADSGTTSTLVDNALTQADDYWNHGHIEITKSGTTYKRIVIDFVAATDTITLDVALPVAIDSDCTYTVYKGCDKTFTTCKAENAWGPSANNYLNFGGFLHIGQRRRNEWK